MRDFKVYLSGPITGLTYGEAIGWTDYAKKKLAYINSVPTGIVGYRPLRGKSFLKNTGPLPAVVNNINIARNKAIVGRDRYDVASSDCVLVNLLDAKIVSIGTMWEMAWAHLLQKPTVVVMEKEGNVHHHAFVLEGATHYTDNLDDGIAMVKAILLD